MLVYIRDHIMGFIKTQTSASDCRCCLLLACCYLSFKSSHGHRDTCSLSLSLVSLSLHIHPRAYVVSCVCIYQPMNEMRL